MAVSKLGGFMAMLEQATKRGHELDSMGYSDTKVGSMWTRRPKYTSSLSGTSTKPKPSVIHSDSLDRDTMALTPVPGTFDESGTFTAETWKKMGALDGHKDWIVPSTSGTSATTAGAFTGTITPEALERLEREVRSSVGMDSETFARECLSGFGEPGPKKKKDGTIEEPLWLKKRKAEAAPSLHGPVLHVVSDPIALPEYLLADLADQAELGQGSAERGGW